MSENGLFRMNVHTKEVYIPINIDYCEDNRNIGLETYCDLALDPLD